jgi:3-methylfumaryl-CoA hydratase
MSTQDASPRLPGPGDRPYRAIEHTEMLTSGPAEALAGLLAVPMPDVAGGEGLPLLWHWVYLLDRPRQADLGPDGQPAVGGMPAPQTVGRRMFAGGRVIRHGLLHVELPATRRTWTSNPREKLGRSGPLLFVTACSEFSQNGEIVLTEERDIVYREPASEGAVPAQPRRDVQQMSAGPDEWAVEVDPVLLFRFSALTYNSHRIHYDRAYAQNVEKYPGLVVHGPLQVLLMAELARRSMPPGANCEFTYRLVSPLFEGQGLIVSGIRQHGVIRLAVHDSAGRPTARGAMRLA